jgi:hypothetical protein
MIVACRGSRLLWSCWSGLHSGMIRVISLLFELYASDTGELGASALRDPPPGCPRAGLGASEGCSGGRWEPLRRTGPRWPALPSAQAKLNGGATTSFRVAGATVTRPLTGQPGLMPVRARAAEARAWFPSRHAEHLGERWDVCPYWAMGRISSVGQGPACPTE